MSAPAVLNDSYAAGSTSLEGRLRKFRRYERPTSAVRRSSANSGRSSRNLNSLQSGRWKRSVKGARESCRSRLQDSMRKLQFPLDCLETRLLAKRIKQRVGLQICQ